MLAQASATPLTSATLASEGKSQLADVVEEEEGLSARGQGVVDAGGDDVLAQRSRRAHERRERGLVPTPSVLETMTGSRTLEPRANSPAKAPMPPEHLRPAAPACASRSGPRRAARFQVDAERRRSGALRESVRGIIQTTSRRTSLGVVAELRPGRPGHSYVIIRRGLNTGLQSLCAPDGPTQPMHSAWLSCLRTRKSFPALNGGVHDSYLAPTSKLCVPRCSDWPGGPGHRKRLIYRNVKGARRWSVRGCSVDGKSRSAPYAST